MDDQKLKDMALTDDDSLELVVTTTLLVEDVRAFVTAHGLEFDEMTFHELWSFVEQHKNVPTMDEFSEFTVL